MRYYPIFLELEHKIVLVVGGGAVAERKVETLLPYGTSVRIVARALTERLKSLVQENRIIFLGRNIEAKHLEGAFLVFAATDDKALNHRISEMARARGVLVNAVDQPADCNFIVPAMVRRGDLCMAVSTSGKSPAFAKKIRKQLDQQFGREYEAFLMLMGRLRKEILSLGLGQYENSRIFQQVVNSDILEALKENDSGAVSEILTGILPKEVSIQDILNDLETH